MIQMQMRLHHKPHIPRRDPNQPQLIDAILGQPHHRVIDIHDSAPMPALVNRGLQCIAAVDHHIALRVFQQKPRHRNFKGIFALIHLDVFGLGLQRAGLEQMQLDPARLAFLPRRLGGRRAEHRTRGKRRGGRSR